MSYGTICGIIANENILLSNSFAKLLSEMEKYVLQYSGSLIKKKTVAYDKYKYKTRPSTKKQIGYWVSEKGKCMKWLYNKN